MGKKINVIEINGKRYDAHTGAALDHDHKGHRRENQPGTVIKPIAVQHTAPAEPKPAKHVPTEAIPHHRPSARKTAKSVAHHRQQRSATLMRQAVHKPSASLKRRIKVQSHTGALIEQPDVEIEPKLSFGALNSKRLEQANRIKKSNLIKHFNPNASAPSSDDQVKVAINRPVVTPKPRLPKDVPRQSAPDLDDIFERAIQHATSHLEPAPKTRKKHRLGLRRKHARA